ncbi:MULTISPECIES: ribonucleoside hydrolase RihC [Oceanobacillus]|jgi:non-specific riboncleoside hydrolase|uniref:Ribonucleoside hydrolase RihC n=1 Tax=Oceanobacillus profundus TaxID=372463 RepID=A0A417YN90_9BACI|nr:ribonucleoside hydrolase RihC [Oceanobacillus profundus]MBR3118642.1 ribonucleoside hydrolase RihC [Oceanobacillus sp.]PAE29193.1 ribonucleoside hydrolase RihC [Paenibacillus sp. 7884-2]MCM3398236.1 ribonucleoside hydrolase RihC [Oceanobacillus profundus]MDO6447860.1 ribonucleoside hydrolase RihC [Oceanobacillus profundus]RHW35068.1 ribonucleoside hydrolase RihC [Oceanobacillus profundus]
MNKKPIIIDTDPGIDDAVALAIALFSEELDVRLITTVNGNVSLEKVTYNMLRLLKFFDKEIPVAKGASTPLIVDPVDASDIHGETGMDGYNFEEPDESLLLDEHAVNAMYKEIMSSKEKITLLPIGPLTNIALLFKLYPEVKENIAEIILMGGSTGRGNASVMAEFNIYADPEAAKIVFSSGLPIVMAGLDVGMKALVYPEDSEVLKGMNDTGNMIYHLFKKYRGGSFNSGLKMYDSCAVAYLLKPDLFTTVDTYVDVELNGGLTKGATIVDLKGYMKQESNVKVCVDINAPAFKKWLMENLRKCK